MKASVSTYCHGGDDDRPHRPVEWEHIQKETERKERVGRPWSCIVNFKTDTVKLHVGGVVFCESVLFPLYGIA